MRKELEEGRIWFRGVFGLRDSPSYTQTLAALVNDLGGCVRD
jgi:hypothetical protein